MDDIINIIQEYHFSNNYVNDLKTYKNNIRNMSQDIDNTARITAQSYLSVENNRARIGTYFYCSCGTLRREITYFIYDNIVDNECWDPTGDGYCNRLVSPPYSMSDSMYEYIRSVF